MLYKIDFEPLGRRGHCPDDKSLLDCARQLGIGILSVCGGQGKCHSCKVQVLTGTVSEPTSSEQDAFSSQELEDGYRLACQTYPLSNCKLRVPSESMTTLQRTQVEGVEVAVRPKSTVHAYYIQLPTPSLSDLRGDAERMLETLHHQHQIRCSHIDIDVLRDISPQLRSWKWQAQASVRNNEVVALGPWPSRQLGLAVDLGTTKIASYLVDLSNGQTLAAKAVMNPQISYGEDVINRIYQVVKSPADGTRLQQLAVEAVNRLIVELCETADAEAEKIVEAVIVGNTAMHHLLLRLPVNQLAHSPFVLAVRDAMNIKSRDIGLHIAPGAYVHLLPNIAGFVGADHVAMLLAIEATQAKGVVIALDIGTNTEVSLLDDDKITSVSCASGPAFEGGHIKDGMRAASGAIERLRVTDNLIQYQTIDGMPPIGLCGSGVLDAMAQLYLVGVLDKGGRMTQNHPRVRVRKKQREFILVSEKEQEERPAITITQQDIRELQLAKGAIRTGIQVLLETTGHSEEEIEQVVIAGAFGTYIDVASAVTIGMLPSLPLARFRQVGNAAGMGAKLALISRSKRTEAQAIASRVHYIELATAANFNPSFVQASYLGRYRITHGKRKEID
jgi:uncharacterized 2Fe-2S/4Fe-4S cluster protein (DUF4445 family)